jgi:hypothetical protein
MAIRGHGGLMASVGLLLAACVPSGGDWGKPGADAAERSRDLATCRAEVTSGREELLATVEDTARGVPTEDNTTERVLNELRTIDDERRQGSAISECMRKLGYTLGPIGEDDGEASGMAQ